MTDTTVDIPVLVLELLADKGPPIGTSFLAETNGAIVRSAQGDG